MVFLRVRSTFWTSPSLVSFSNPVFRLSADIFLFGDWDLEAAGIPSGDPQIQSLYNELRASAVDSRAASTLKSYSGYWLRFKTWCLEKGVPSLPAAPLTVALYFTLLLRSASSPSPVLSTSAAIFLYHSLAGLPSPTRNPLVAMAREIAKRTKVAGQNVKKPFLASHCRRLFELWHLSASANLHTRMKLMAVILCYAGFLRFSDLIIVQWHEIRFLPSHMELFLEKSKTDQYRQGRWVLIARVGGPFCPVTLTEYVLFLGQYDRLGPGGLIRCVTISRSQQYIRKEQPCYTTVNSWFKDAAAVLGLNPAEYGTHSGRRGGASRAANVDVPDRLFKEHGSWKSERAKDMYVVSKLQSRLSVTVNLGLQPGVSLAELEQFERDGLLASP